MEDKKETEVKNDNEQVNVVNTAISCHIKIVDETTGEILLNTRA